MRRHGKANTANATLCGFVPPRCRTGFRWSECTDAVKGALRNTFDVVPDAPVSKFILELFGGKRGLIVNSQDLCAKRRHRASVKLDGHNGKPHDFRPVVRNGCGKKVRKKARGGKRR